MIRLDPTRIIVIVDGSKVLVISLGFIIWVCIRRTLASWCSIAKLWFVFSVLLLQRGNMWIHAAQVGWITAKLHPGWGVLGDLDLASHSSTADYLSSGGTILHISNLCGCLSSLLPHPLYLGNNLLVFTVLSIPLQDAFISLRTFRFINFQLEDSVVWACSATVRASSNASATFVVEWCFSCRLIRHFRLSTLGGVHSTSYRSVWCILITDL